MCRHLSLNTRTSDLLQDMFVFSYYLQVLDDQFAALEMYFDILIEEIILILIQIQV